MRRILGCGASGAAFPPVLLDAPPDAAGPAAAPESGSVGDGPADPGVPGEGAPHAVAMMNNEATIDPRILMMPSAVVPLDPERPREAEVNGLAIPVRHRS